MPHAVTKSCAEISTVYLAGDAIPVRMIRQEIPKKSAALQLVKPTTMT